MNNLGGYQVLTTIAKKVGGPKKLIALIVGGSAVVGTLVFEGGKIAFRKGKETVAHFKRKNQKSYQDLQVIYIIKQDGESNEGLKLKKGDSFRVLESDGDAVLIELIGNTNNPYFVSKKLLEHISDYKENNGAI